MRENLIRQKQLRIGAAAAFHAYRSDAAETPSYLTATVTRKDLSDSVLATGTLEAFKQVSVGAQVSGQIKSLKVAIGDRVTKGQEIAEIDSLTQQNNLKQAEAQFAVAEDKLVDAVRQVLARHGLA